jgi:hypothetical protein
MVLGQAMGGVVVTKDGGGRNGPEVKACEKLVKEGKFM